MKLYKDWAPTSHDAKGLRPNCEDGDVSNWGVVLTKTRDSGLLEAHNFDTVCLSLKEDDSEYKVLRFGHWACGWFEVLLVKPDTQAWKIASRALDSLSEYPILDEDTYMSAVHTEANETWEHAETIATRIQWIRDNRSECEFRSFSDLLGACRGKWFPGENTSYVEGA